jgi:drug/metabolite transporter (DMT)-like permease
VGVWHDPPLYANPRPVSRIASLAPRALRARFDALPGAVRGAAWMTLTGALFSLNSAAVREIAHEVHPFEIAFFRSLIGLPLMLPWLLGVGLAGLATRNRGLYVARGTLSGVATMLWFLALALIPIADATAISFVSPIVTSIAAMVILRETMGLNRWTAVACGFAGVVVILRPGFAEVNAGTWLVLASTLCVAFNSVMVKTATRTDSPDTIAFYQIAIMVPVTFVPALFFWSWPTWHGWLWIAVIAVISTTAHRTLGRAFAAADVTAIQPFDFLRMPFAVAIGWAMFAELPDAWTWAGAIVIFASSAYIAQREAAARRRARAKAAP